MYTTVYSLTSEQYEKEVNVGRFIILRELYDKGIIELDVYEDYINNYAIIIKKASFFSSFWEKFYSDNKERYILVKQQTLVEHDDEPNEKKAELKVVEFDKKED
jgi:hypothetical protein